MGSKQRMGGRKGWGLLLELLAFEETEAFTSLLPRRSDRGYSTCCAFATSESGSTTSGSTTKELVQTCKYASRSCRRTMIAHDSCDQCGIQVGKLGLHLLL